MHEALARKEAARQQSIEKEELLEVTLLKLLLHEAFSYYCMRL
jgi:hypothetical protein